MTSITTKNPKYFKSAVGTCCFVNLTELNKDGKYAVDILWDKNDPTLPLIKAEIDKVGKTEFGSKKWRHPLRDGDEKADQYPEYAGKAYITFRAQPSRPPELRGPDKSRLVNPTIRDLYSGMKGCVIFSIYYYNGDKNIGVACGLEAFQKTAEGTPIVSKVNPDEVDDMFDTFDSVSNDALFG